MIMHVFSVYDAAVSAYLPPFFCRSRGEAVRSFTEACNNREHQFWKHAGDYHLFRLGEFDDANGTFTCGVPGRVLSALEVVEGIELARVENGRKGG